MVDVISGVVALLTADTTINTLVGGRIYGAELPESEAPNMPEKAIVITQSGGIDENGIVEIMKPRIDIYCYGETFFEAGKVERAVYSLLKYTIRQTISGMLIHGFAVSSGAIQLKEAATNAAILWRSYVATVSETII